MLFFAAKVVELREPDIALVADAGCGPKTAADLVGDCLGLAALAGLPGAGLAGLAALVAAGAATLATCVDAELPPETAVCDRLPGLVACRDDGAPKPPLLCRCDGLGPLAAGACGLEPRLGAALDAPAAVAAHDGGAADALAATTLGRGRGLAALRGGPGLAAADAAMPPLPGTPGALRRGLAATRAATGPGLPAALRMPGRGAGAPFHVGEAAAGRDGLGLARLEEAVDEAAGVAVTTEPRPAPVGDLPGDLTADLGRAPGCVAVRGMGWKSLRATGGGAGGAEA